MLLDKVGTVMLHDFNIWYAMAQCGDTLVGIFRFAEMLQIHVHLCHIMKTSQMALQYIITVGQQNSALLKTLKNPTLHCTGLHCTGCTSLVIRMSCGILIIHVWHDYGFCACCDPHIPSCWEHLVVAMMLCSWLVILYPKAGIIIFFYNCRVTSFNYLNQLGLAVVGIRTFLLVESIWWFYIQKLASSLFCNCGVTSFKFQN